MQPLAPPSAQGEAYRRMPVLRCPSAPKGLADELFQKLRGRNRSAPSSVARILDVRDFARICSEYSGNIGNCQSGSPAL